MSFKDLNKNLQNYILKCFCLLIVYWIISSYEILSLVFLGNEIPNIFKLIGFKFLNDLVTVLVVFAIFYPLYYLISRKNVKAAVFTVKSIFIILILAELAMTQYSLTTLLNLGADLLGYSLDDILLTVSSSESGSFLSYLPFIIFPLMFSASCFFLRKSTFFKYSGRIFIAVTLIVVLMKFGLSDFSQDIYQNKTSFFVTDIIKVQIEKSEIETIKLENGNEYPLLRDVNTFEDVLTPHFNLKAEKPNIVVILVEGLGSEFVNKKEFAGFMPYLDALVDKSLFWDNFLANTGRTFGALPSFTASVPFGVKGFLELQETPFHISLFSLLKKNGYSTSFFSGDQSSFDKKINFLEYNAVENIIDENKYESFYPKSVNGASGFSWGFSDYEIFKKTLSTLDDIPKPRFDLITTQTMHEPFEFPLEKEYAKKIDSILNSNTKLYTTKKKIETYKNIFATVHYADNSIKMFMENYKKRPEFQNTIFIITGDHRIIPIPQKDQLCRFNVPFYIYSPMLKKGKSMKSVSSHFDVAPSVLTFLSNNFDINLPKNVSWMGDGIDTTSTFRNIHKIPLMRYKGRINDFVYKDYMLSDGNLYKIKDDFNTYSIADGKVLDSVKSFLKDFKNINAYVTKNNKIIPETSEVTVAKGYKFSKEELEGLSKITEGLNPDQIFLLAREKAFNGQRDSARLISNYLLRSAPNYVDVRILKGRTLAWDKKYDKAEEELKNALKRAPFYYDIYHALMDMYWWSGQNDKVIELAKKAQQRNIKNDDIAYKLARSYRSLNESNKALKIIDSILKKNPKNKEYIKFKKSVQ